MKEKDKKQRRKNVLEKTFQPFILQCHKGGGFWQVQLLPNPLHKEARNTLYVTVVGDTHPFTTPPALYFISELIYVLLFHCCGADRDGATSTPTRLPSASPSSHGQIQPGLSCAWPHQQQNCQATAERSSLSTQAPFSSLWLPSRGGENVW